VRGGGVHWIEAKWHLVVVKMSQWLRIACGRCKEVVWLLSAFGRSKEVAWAPKCPWSL